MRVRFLMPSVVLLAAVFASLASAAVPPNGVYTCIWIAAHPSDAALAGVSCSPVAPPVVPGAFGAFIAAPAAPLVSGEVCLSIPGSGKVGMGVFAWTPAYYYSNYWDIDTNDTPPNYTWYIQKIDGTNVWAESETDIQIHSHMPAANDYRGGAQNHSGTATSWRICHAAP